MKRVNKSYQLISQLSDGFIPLVAVAILLPVVVLSGFGIVALINNGQWILFFALIAISCLIVFVPYWFIRRKRVVSDAVSDDLAPLHVEGNPQWGAHENQVWQEVTLIIQQQLSDAPEWESLQAHAYVLVAEVADRFNKGKSAQRLSFTAPEFLLMVEEVSRRYRYFLQEHVPFAEKITLKSLQQGYQLKDKVGYAKSAYDVYRLFRIATPTGWLAEARGLVLGKLFDDVSLEVQTKLKMTLLQEVASVAIDLYSGHFKLDDASVPHSKMHDKDQQAEAVPIEPLRVAVIGQISAGKSSVVNGLLGEMSAEISALPSTDKATTYRCEVEGTDVINLIDLPGIDGTESINQMLLKQVTQSDVVLWVLKANQSSRQADIMLKQMIEEFYTQPKNQHRKAPKIIVLVNQVDKLKPVDEWLPPYDLNDIQTKKGEIILDAVSYNQNLMKSDTIIPLSVSSERLTYNLDVLQETIQEVYQEGINTQLNRRRIDGDRIDYTEQAQRLYRLGKLVFDAAVK
ncbi:GTPase [Photobacterium sp. GB-27]|uniref:GTPase family protein n=1 Tax=Photobacterium sp. GB-27 TaxID=2022109 RepID=UPI000D170905|nr:GTPase [Photobacterium sp. GB-27]PSV37250.1 GTPase [Photobacterium sp. GB-27]